MKRLWILILALMLSAPVWADVTAEIIAYDLSPEGNIRIMTQYKIDGVEVPSRYPKVDGKYVWYTQYNATNFAGMTATQAKQRIGADIKEAAENFLKKKYLEVENQDLINTFLTNLVGMSATYSNATIQVDTNGDGIADKVWSVSSDGTRTESDL